jgi:hypothetical protein
LLGRTLVVVFVLLGLDAADAPAPAEAAKRCKASQVKTKVTILKTKGHRRHRATVCVPRKVKRPASPAAGLSRSRAIALKRAHKRVRRLMRKKAARRIGAADAGADRGLLRALGPLAGAAKVTHESDTQILPGPPGTRTVQHREATVYDDDEPDPGGVIDASIDTTSTRIEGLASHKSVRASMTRTMARCPDSGGVGRGVLKYTNNERRVIDKGNGGHAVVEVRTSFDAKVLAQFNDEAAVTKVDVIGVWKWTTTSSLSTRRGASEQQLSTFGAGGGVTGQGDANGRVGSFSSTTTSATSPYAAGVGPLLAVLANEVPRDFVRELVDGIQRRAGRGKCTRLVPEPATVHVQPSRTVAVTSGLVDFDGAPLPGKVKAKAAKATVTPEAQADPTARFTYSALSSVPAGRTDTVTLSHVSKRGRAVEKTVTVIYDDPPLPDAYGGTVSGTWDTASFGSEHWTYSGTVNLAYEGDDPAPPPGGRPGRYRRFGLTSGSAHVNATITFSDGCGVAGGGNVTIDPGQSGYLSVEAVEKPMYLIGLRSNGKTVTLTRTGSADSCHAGETVDYPVPGIWAQTESAHASAASTLADTEDDSTPESPFDYDTVSHWSLVPH